MRSFWALAWGRLEVPRNLQGGAQSLTNDMRKSPCDNPTSSNAWELMLRFAFWTVYQGCIYWLPSLLPIALIHTSQMSFLHSSFVLFNASGVTLRHLGQEKVLGSRSSPRFWITNQSDGKRAPLLMGKGVAITHPGCARTLPCVSPTSFLSYPVFTLKWYLALK